MLSLILKDKKFDIENLLSFLNKTGLSESNFIENFGEIDSSENFYYLMDLKEKLKNFNINSAIIEKKEIKLPSPIQIKKIEIEGEIIKFFAEKFFSANFKDIDIIALGIIYKTIFSYNPHKENNLYEIENKILGTNQISKDINFYLEIFLKNNARICANSEELDYYSSLTKKEFSSYINFKNLLLDLKKFSTQAITNKTFDLFSQNKNIKYFIYTEYREFENEIIWLQRVKNNLYER